MHPVTIVASVFLAYSAVSAQGTDSSELPTVGQLQRAQREAARALQRRDYAAARQALDRLEQLAQRIVEAETASSIAKRRARAALGYVERMRRRHADKLSGGEPKKPPAEQRPMDKGTVSFVRDIAPLLQRNCVRCHGGNRPRSGFSVETYNSLLRGGDRGDDVVPGKPEESLLVLLLQGKEEPRMPPNRALRADLIKLFETWIKEGARFDGSPEFSPDTPLDELVPSEEEKLRRKLAALSPKERAAYYDSVARRYWQMAIPGREPVVAESAHFRGYGNVDGATLKKLLSRAEAALRILQGWIRRKPSDLWSGKLALFVYSSRYYYLEHTRMVERREMPALVYGHFRPAVELPYAVLYTPDGAEQVDAEVAVAQAITDAYLSSVVPESPAWLKAALALKVASTLNRGSQYVLAVRNMAVDELPVTPADVKALLLGQMPYARARLVGYLLLEGLSGRARRELPSLVEAVADRGAMGKRLEGKAGELLLARFAALINAAAGAAR